jgi:threonine efflux protein
MGIGVVFSTHPALRQAAQIAGGLYLLYLAFNLWRAGAVKVSKPQGELSNVAAFQIGFMTSALNPKIALFYGSVFATSLPQSPSWLHVVGAVAVVYCNSMVWHTSLAVALSQKTVQRAYLRNFARLTKASGAVVGAFGLRLILGTIQELRARAP